MADSVNIKGRDYSFHAAGGQTLFRINDSAAPFLATLARNFGPELNKALGSLGWTLRDKVRQSMRAGGPPGANWSKSAGIGKLHRDKGVTHETELKRKRHAARKIVPKGYESAPVYGRLVQAIAYRRDKANMRVQIGFLSPSASKLGMRLQEGFSTSITQKMRRLYSARGLEISAKGSVVTPPRPLIGPVFEAVRDQIPTFLEQKISVYLASSSRLFHNMGM